jgi:hypothetical protein
MTTGQQVRIDKQADWDKFRVGYAKYTMGDQGSTRNYHNSLLGKLTSRATFYVNDSRGTRPGPLIVDRRSLELEKDTTREAAKDALVTKILGNDQQVAALTVSDDYLVWRQKERDEMEALQVELDAKRARLLEEERDREEQELEAEMEEERSIDRRHDPEMERAA